MATSFTCVILACAAVAVHGAGLGRRDTVDCACPLIWNPVCDEDGNVYGNPCDAACQGVTAGPCPSISTLPELPLKKELSRGLAAGDDDVCACTHLYDPVCASDGTQYDNDCEARCAGVTDATACPVVQPLPVGVAAQPVCRCPANYNPVCGSNGVQYANDCTARCAGITDATPGPCIQTLPAGQTKRKLKPSHTKRQNVCVCPASYVPVCGTDGNTYSNQCVANCAIAEDRLDSTTPGACQCACNRAYRPVCDTNNVKYNNRCIATNCFNVADNALRSC